MPTGIIYDRASDRVVVVSGDGGTIILIKPDIDPKAGKIDAPVALGGAPEFLSLDGAGKVYVNLMDKNEVAVVDMKARKVLARWPVAPGGARFGMTTDTAKRRLLIGCRKPQKSIVMSIDNITARSSRIYRSRITRCRQNRPRADLASCADGALAVVNGRFAIAQTVKTPKGARTMDVDPITPNLTAYCGTRNGRIRGKRARQFRNRCCFTERGLAGKPCRKAIISG